MNTYKMNGRVINVSIKAVNNFDDQETKDGNKDEENIQNVVGNKIRKSAKVKRVEENLDGLKIEIFPQVGNTVLNQNDVVYEKQVIKYVIKVTNNSNNTITNLKVLGDIPNGTKYAELVQGTYYEEKYEYELHPEITKYDNTIDKIEINETKELFFEVKVDDLNNVEDAELQSSITVYHQNTEIKKFEQTNIIKPAELSVDLVAYVGRDGRRRWYYYLKVTNLTNKDIENVVAKVNIPKELEVDGIYNMDANVELGDNFWTLNGKVLEANIGKVEKGSQRTLGIVGTAKDVMEDSTSQYELRSTAEVYGDNTKVYESNENRVYGGVESVAVKMTSEKEGKNLKNNEDVEYEITIKNTGELLEEINSYTTINVIDYLPEELKPVSITYDRYTLIYTKDDKGNIVTDNKFNRETITEEKNTTFNEDGSVDPVINMNAIIPMGESIKIIIKAKAKFLYEDTQIENFATVTGDYIKTKVSNSIKNTVLPYDYEPDNPDNPDNPNNPSNPDNPDNPNKPDNPDNPNNPDNPDNSELFKINGQAWIDANKNGKKDDNEQRISGVTVKLFSAENNSIVTDKSNNVYKTTTDSEGKYIFNNVKNGKYLVVFEYDTEKYSLTSYKKDGVNDNFNSDATSQNVNIDGQLKDVGITDILEVNSKNLSNIDIGLAEKGKFNLSVEKYVDKVTVVNALGNKEYKYDNVKLAKVEIPSKQIKNTTIDIEYKIVIKNEGNINAYVTEISDYIPDGFEVTSDKKWTINNGCATNKQLAGIAIKPNETKEVTINISKKLDSDELGKVVNKVELSGIYNSSSITEINNKNNSSEAEVVISVKTGIIRNISIVIILLTLIFILFVNRKNVWRILRKIRIGSMLSMIIIVFVVSYSGISNAKYGDTNVDIKGSDWNDDSGHFGKFVDKNDDVYDCQNPGWAMCSKWHTYTLGDSSYNKVFIKSTETSSGNSSITVTKGNGTVNVYGSNDDNIIVGPFCFNSTVSDASYNLTVNNESGDAVNYSIVNSSGTGTSFSWGTDFYLKVSNSTTKLNVSVTGTTSYSYYKYTYYEAQYFYKDPVRVDFKAHTSNCKGNKHIQNMASRNKHEIVETTEAETKNPSDTSETYVVQVSGEIQIKKSDADTGEGLNGAKFKVTGPNNYDKDFTISENGTIKISNLPIGSYTVTEIGTPNSYNLDLQDNKVVTVSVTAGDTVDAVINNKQYGNLKVTKKDEDTGDTSLGEVKLSGVQFKLYVLKSNTKYYLKNTTSTKYSYSDFDETKKESAMTFKTDDNAQFEVDNLPVYEGKNKITYYIEEYALPSELAEYYQVKTEPDTIQLVNGTTQAKVIKNKQIYLDVSGYVWEDKPGNNKQTLRNDLYDSNETLISDVTVRLKRKGDINNDGVINQKDIDLLTYHLSGRSILTGEEYDRADLNNDGVVDVKDGVAISKIANSKTDLSATLQTTKTDSQNGAYKFRKVKIDELANYYIEFEYNGLRYQNVTKKLDKDNGSKAIENANNRKKFNNSYSTISGGNSKDKSGTKGSTLDENGNATNILTYTNGTYSSSLVPNTAYTAESTKNSVSPQNGSMGAVIKANTKDAGYSLDQWKGGVVEVKNVNLGIAERSQPDLTIASDLDNMNMTINNYEHTYNFGQRADYINAGIPDINVNSGYNSLLDGFNVFVKNNKGTYRDITYQRGIEDSYIAFTKENKDSDERLRIYLTYKIVIKNESTIPFVKVKGLRNYSDADLDFVDSYIENGTSTDAKVTWKNVGKTSDSKRNIWQSGEIDTFVEPGKLKTIYLKFELKTDAICKLADLKANGGEVRIVGNTTEITAYSSYDSNKNAYAGIDMDSAPGNISYGDISTYEDDTDSTPDLKIMRKDPKVVSGLVFEDEKEENKKNDRIGDGKYEKGNNVVSGVNVQMVNYGGDDIITLYTLDEKGDVIKTPANKTTGKDGKFEFVGIIPGEYVTKYTYGKKGNMQTKINSIDVTTQNYKSTIITNDKFKQAVQNRSEYWYQDTALENYSSALDDWTKRTEINNHLKVNTYAVKNDYDNNKDDEKYHYMAAKTGKMTFPIEDKKNQTTNYDYVEPSRIYNIKFGIIERPRQSLEVNKEISYIKLTLQNGTVLVEGDPRTTAMNYVTYPEKGMLKIAMDNNLVQGSTLQVEYTISVKNKSEADYNTESYYKYGTYNKTDKCVSLIVNSIVDYMDDGLTTEYTASSSDWKLKNGANIKNSLSPKAYDVIKNRKNILLNEWKKEILQNETQYLKVEASKIVSASDDNLYENYTEILSSTSDVGRFYGEEINGSWKNYTPGNYDLTNDTHESDDNGYDHISRATLTIVPPTGSDNHVIYYIIGISCLIVIAGGVVIIKKFVL